MSRQRLRTRPDLVRAAFAEARVYGLRQRHQNHLENARGRELTHQCRRCGHVIRLLDYVCHLEACEAPQDEPP
jgi:hypothetical protein